MEKKIEGFNQLNAELNPIGHLLALFGDHHILHVSRLRTNAARGTYTGRSVIVIAP